LNQGVATGDSPTFVDVTATSLDISGDIDVEVMQLLLIMLKPSSVLAATYRFIMMVQMGIASFQNTVLEALKSKVQMLSFQI
jgi:hypothetical protein